MGSRNRSTHASQYRVGNQSRTEPAASSVTSTVLPTSTASPPSAAPSEESVTVERNSDTAATPSMDQPMYATMPAVRSSSCTVVNGVPDTVDVAYDSAAGS